MHLCIGVYVCMYIYIYIHTPCTTLLRVLSDIHILSDKKFWTNKSLNWDRRSKLRGSEFGCLGRKGLNMVVWVGRGLNWGRSELGGSELGGSELEGSELGGSELVGSEWGGSELEGSELVWSEWGGSELEGSELVGSELVGSELEGSELSRDLGWEGLNR